MTSHTIPTQASALRVGGYMCIKERPCKITDVKTSKTGKHGGNKCHFYARDIFTDQVHEHLEMSTKNIEVPYVTKNDYQLVGIDEDTVSYLDHKGNNQNDLSMPNLSDSDMELSDTIREKFADGEELYITVISAMGISAIKGFQISK